MDPSNALLPGVSITVEGAAIQGQRTAESEANGSYRFLNLPPGEYRVTYQKAKFKKIVYEGAKVEVGKTLTMNVTMQIADIEETLVVTGSSPIVDVQNATVGTNFGDAMLRDIPNQRDLFALLAQTPGITMPRVDVGGNTAGTQSAYRAYGLSGQSITTVDGVNITVGSAGVGAYIDYGALAEAKVSAAGNSAEVAVAGAAVTTVIKSGSNTHHGEFYADFKPGGSKALRRCGELMCGIATSMASSVARSSRTGSGTSRHSAISTPRSPPGCTTSRQRRAAHKVSRSPPKRRTTPSS